MGHPANERTVRVTTVNKLSKKNPLSGLLNESPEVNAWTVKLTDVVEKPDDLLDRQEYDAYLQSESE